MRRGNEVIRLAYWNQKVKYNLQRTFHKIRLKASLTSPRLSSLNNSSIRKIRRNYTQIWKLTLKDWKISWWDWKTEQDNHRTSISKSGDGILMG